jgi:redox-sensing transcriptional repressor
MRYRRVPDETIRRLPLYLRGIQFLSNRGQRNICSTDLAEFLGVNDWQVRKDFSFFGDFGVPGVGYDVKRLQKEINKILRLERGHNAALVGVGNLGTAVLMYQGFKQYGFNITAAFDNNPQKIGKRIKNIIIEDISNLHTLGKRNIRIAIIAVPQDSAQEIADMLVKSGVKGILNFSPQYIVVPKKVKVITIDIAMDLARMPYYIPADRADV